MIDFVAGVAVGWIACIFLSVVLRTMMKKRGKKVLSAFDPYSPETQTENKTQIGKETQKNGEEIYRQVLSNKKQREQFIEAWLKNQMAPLEKKLEKEEMVQEAKESVRGPHLLVSITDEAARGTYYCKPCGIYHKPPLHFEKKIQYNT